MENIREISSKLLIAKKRLEKTIKALAPKHKVGEMQEFQSARSELLGIERELAEAKGDEHAVTIDFPVQWDVGAPMPHVIASENKVFLIFLLSDPDSNWDGTYVAAKDACTGQPEPLALVEFARCTSFKMGSPNEEVHRGHPLSGKGLEGYRAQEVIRSNWLKELENINKVHSNYRPDLWRGRHHYIFWFHDSTFECIAGSYKVETFNESFPELVAMATKRLWER